MTKLVQVYIDGCHETGPAFREPRVFIEFISGRRPSRARLVKRGDRGIWSFIGASLLRRFRQASHSPRYTAIIIKPLPLFGHRSCWPEYETHANHGGRQVCRGGYGMHTFHCKQAPTGNFLPYTQFKHANSQCSKCHAWHGIELRVAP